MLVPSKTFVAVKAESMYTILSVKCRKMFRALALGLKPVIAALKRLRRKVYKTSAYRVRPSKKYRTAYLLSRLFWRI